MRLEFRRKETGKKKGRRKKERKKETVSPNKGEKKK